jgi:serine/threonine protein kinase
MVHSDLKPDNVLVKVVSSFPVEVKVIDFGSAFSYAGTGRVNAATPEYMPPESLMSGATI